MYSYYFIIIIIIIKEGKRLHALGTMICLIIEINPIIEIFCNEWKFFMNSGFKQPSSNSLGQSWAEGGKVLESERAGRFGHLLAFVSKTKSHSQHAVPVLTLTSHRITSLYCPFRWNSPNNSSKKKHNERHDTRMHLLCKSQQTSAANKPNTWRQESTEQQLCK